MIDTVLKMVPLKIIKIRKIGKKCEVCTMTHSNHPHLWDPQKYTKHHF